MRLSNKRYMIICTVLCILLIVQVNLEAKPNNKSFSIVSMTLHDKALAGAHDVELSNNIAFVAGKGQSLSIIDITNPQKPEILWYKNDPEIPDSETVLPVGKHLLLGTRDFLSLDIRNPDNPVILKKISDRPRIDHINGMVKHGDYVFAASKSGWVNAFDVKDLNNPELFGVLETRKQFNIRHPHDIDIFNDYIVVVDPVRFGPPVGKVALFKVMEKGTVLPVKQWKLEGVVEGEELIGANRVQIKGSVAYIGGAYSSQGREEAGVDSGHMCVVDISNPKKPEIICQVPFTDTRGPVGLTIAGNIVFCAGGQSIDAFDISDPLKPIKLAGQSFEIYKKANKPGNYHDLIYRDGYLYISAQTDNGFLILKVDDSRIRKLADSR